MNKCREHILCPPDAPNYSSEDAERDSYLSIVYEADGCIGHCTSTISQMDADLCALRQAMECVNNPPPPNPPPDNPPPPPPPRPTFFTNVAQECAVPCPSGGRYVFLVPAGLFVATTQEEADAQAHSYACEQAPLNMFCLGPLLRCVCAGFPFSSTIEINTHTSDTGLTLSNPGGGAPSGIHYAQDGNQITVSGIFAAGNYAWTLRATDDAGNYAENTYVLFVIDVADTTLPNFEIGVPYSHQMTAVGGSGNYAWKIDSGTLPTGVTMSLSGLISGTPTAGGSTILTFEVIDLDCNQTDRSFFPPQIRMTTRATNKIATVLGFSEFSPTVPPKKYKSIEYAGTSEHWATPFNQPSDICARAKYVYSGTSSIDSNGNFLTRYKKDLYQLCPGNRQWPINAVEPNLGPLVLTGYCWPDDPDSCGNCSLNPPPLDADMSSNTNSDFSDLLGGRDFTAFSSDHFEVVGSRLTVCSIFKDGHAPVGFPISRVNSQDAAWVICHGSNNYQATLSNEYTDAEALIYAYTYVTDGNVAQNTPRTTGFTSYFTTVQFTLTCYNLIEFEDYTVRVRFYNTRTGASVFKFYSFIADGTGTQIINDTIPTPPAGEPVLVKDPLIKFTT